MVIRHHIYVYLIGTAHGIELFMAPRCDSYHSQRHFVGELRISSSIKLIVTAAGDHDQFKLVLGGMALERWCTAAVGHF